MTQRAIEVSFPIVEINRLAVPERNSFKPIYQMHKWFARRASCVFRAILLGCLKDAGTDIMAEFYKDHTHDADTNGKVILDPFMGGGTTVVEALRLGSKVIGIDLNPVAWFIVKTEVEPVNIDDLQAAFDRLAQRTVPWSGKPLRETLLDQYKTTCSCCQREADIMYTFWVKSAICHNATCPARVGERGVEVPLFSNYIVAQKGPSIRYWRDVTCPKCSKTFDWEIEPAALVAEADLQVNAPRSAGLGRSSARWAYSTDKTVTCPWCNEVVQPPPPKSKTPGVKAKPERKKVPLTVLLCPKCEAVWQHRGDLPENATCPACAHAYDPQVGNVPDNGKFLCPHCGTKDSVIASLRRLPDDQLLPMRPYAIEGYCGRCGGEVAEEDDGRDDDVAQLSFEGERKRVSKRVVEPDHACTLTENGGKFFRRLSTTDLAIYQQAADLWQQEKSRLPHPNQKVPIGDKTKSGLHSHHYFFWHQMFNPRQLLCLASTLDAIRQEPDQRFKESFLTTFQTLLDRNNMFCRYFNDRNTVQAGFSRHDFQPKLTPAETNIWGRAEWRGTIPNLHLRTVEGKQYGYQVYDNKVGENGTEHVPSAEIVYGLQRPTLLCDDSASSPRLSQMQVDFVVTDPPYAGNVNYAELADFFYVWLRLALAESYPQFAPDETPKLGEVIENVTRGKTSEDFGHGLTSVFEASCRVLKSDGLLVFTFHHAEGQAWESVLRAVCEAGFEIAAAYPVHGEKESSLNLQDSQSISYDLVHVCKKRASDAAIEKRSWAGIRQEIRRLAREEIRAIEAGRYGNEPLAPSDVNIVLIGKCLELYSRHYGAVVDHLGAEVPLHDALIEIRSLVDQLVEKQRPLPSELDDLDAESRVYLLTLAGQKEIKSDDVHKATRGILEPDDLMRAGLMKKGRAKRGRTFEVKQPLERLADLLDVFSPDTAGVTQMSFLDDGAPAAPSALRAKHRTLFIDEIHLLLGLADSGENLMPWLERFSGDRARIRAACEYLAEKNKSFADGCQKVLRLLDPGPLFRSTE